MYPKLVRSTTPISVLVTMTYISNLANYQTCFGNVAVGEAHLQGLIAILDTMDKHNRSSDDYEDADRELADRYVIF
jgi:hypothetical protein